MTVSLKQQVQNYIGDIADELSEISHSLHDHPELAFQEHRSMALLADAAERHGFQVQRGVAGLDTAFIARSINGAEHPAIAILAEYDALPGLGHACGHNVIATSALGAALALQSVREQLPGVIELIGTPAEEKGGGKAIMVERGVFDDLDAAMMIHPGNKNMVDKGSIASNAMVFEFFGKAAHAAAAPDQGINALDACIQTFNCINALRQHLPPDVRIHGIITHGGEASNIVPAYARAEFGVRAATSDVSLDVVEKVKRCAKAGALAAGATVKIQHLRHYAHRLPNPTIAKLFADNLRLLGQPVARPAANERRGSSDMGNVSHVIPAIHPYIAMVPEDVGAHTPRFALAAGGEAGDRAWRIGAQALAMTAVDLFLNPESLTQAKAELAAMTNPNARWRRMHFFSNQVEDA